MTASEDMKVKVENGLAALLAVVDDHTITIGQATILGDLASSQKQFSQNLEKNYKNMVLKNDTTCCM